MSRSPRKLLRTAAQALEALHTVWERYPEARAEAEQTLGPGQMAQLAGARQAVVRAADIFATETAERGDTIVEDTPLP